MGGGRAAQLQAHCSLAPAPLLASPPAPSHLSALALPLAPPFPLPFPPSL